MKPILMIHEFSADMLDLPLHKYTLTFDDGLYTQYMFIDELCDIDTDKIFFITTNIVADDDVIQSDEFIKCGDAHIKAKTHGDMSNYMNWLQIKEINSRERCEIGGHSHNHQMPKTINMLSDTRDMIDTFHKHNINVDKFCYPYNEEDIIYEQILKSKGINKFYGTERVDIYDIM